MQDRHLHWWTPHLSRDFEMLVFGDGRGIPLILFPTSFGRFYQTIASGPVQDAAPWFTKKKKLNRAETSRKAIEIATS